jgi:Rad3-related DNA helicase
MGESEAKTKIRISVRNLVEFILRSGDIDNRIGKGVQKEAMQEGSRMHRKIQRRMGSGYQAEVSLKLQMEEPHYIISLEGRADGIFTDKKVEPNTLIPLQEEDTEICYIDEIKCMYTDVTRMEEVVEVHRAQAMCYAYIYAKQQHLEEIGIQLTYCNLDTEEIRQFRECLTFSSLCVWFEELMDAYRKWTDFQYEWNLLRQASIQHLEFPFPYRKGQKKLAGDVYRTILRKKTLFIQAPTGTGKTISTVFPAVKAVGEGLGDKIFYLTAKTITRTVAKDAFDLLKEKGYQGKVITITAKEKLCPCEEMDCNPLNCPYAKGHYDRVNDAVYELVTEQSDFTREVLLAQANKHQVCPFEMALDVSLWSDVIICDYNYVFDPNVYLKRFFQEGVKGDYIFLVDEAHNLVERGREMYSATLVKEDFMKIRKILHARDPKVASALSKCNHQMLEWKRDCEKYTTYESIGAFAFSLMRLMALLDTFLQNRSDIPERKEITEFYLNLRHFMNMFERMDENYALYTDFREDGCFCLHLYCVNPSVNLQECIDRGNSAIFFSATLLPIQYYKNLLSSREDNYAVYAESTFDASQRLLFVARDVSSLYTRRTVDEFRRIAAYIQMMAQAKTGNYIAFFPSYQFMEDVYEQFLALNLGEMDCMIQGSGMQEEEREAFISRFAESGEKSLVAFCVLGGIFSEGIDLKHDQLIGVLIVGTGLPQICNEREVLKNHYQTENGQGFDYAYQYPGMNKVLQAAGRVIRTASDCGVIGLLDERFLRRDYRQLFPREWEDYQVHTLESLPSALEQFWADKIEM